jgi:hypothetical protein
MHFPKSKKTKDIGDIKQQNILQQMVDNKDPDTGRPIAGGPHGYSKWLVDEAARLKIWKMLRELDTMPVFIPHLEKELYGLLKRNSRISSMRQALKNMLDELGD